MKDVLLKLLFLRYDLRFHRQYYGQCTIVVSSVDMNKKVECDLPMDHHLEDEYVIRAIEHCIDKLSKYEKR